MLSQPALCVRTAATPCAIWTKCPSVLAPVLELARRCCTLSTSSSSTTTTTTTSTSPGFYDFVAIISLATLTQISFTYKTPFANTRLLEEHFARTAAPGQPYPRPSLHHALVPPASSHLFHRAPEALKSELTTMTRRAEKAERLLTAFQTSTQTPPTSPPAQGMPQPQISDQPTKPSWCTSTVQTWTGLNIFLSHIEGESANFARNTFAVAVAEGGV
ncbi:uncharacterized protein BXZ73DRAFT_78048 [Epithele typhae]|uniref:uncharacterized protein n=1 Tax=Epithele typhae TaxID=378194 RepID=UPI0020077B1D|nr:uncharacterized protein BXZ73DRAFT_78048 [Epithele typhae]KAH9929943.1 hypothetical protein BXZ73DRAFT_78048 [Epithele typhae]